jgi:hypothetical protein
VSSFELSEKWEHGFVEFKKLICFIHTGEIKLKLKIGIAERAHYPSAHGTLK